MMSENESSATTASHTLAYLRRLDRQHSQLVELVVRRQDLISRLEREMREGFGLLQREVREGFSRNDRDLKELKSDLVVVENSILNRVADHYETSRRIDEQDDCILGLETAAKVR